MPFSFSRISTPALRRTCIGSAFALVGGLSGCGALDVTDPTQFRVENLSNAIGATALVSGVRLFMSYAYNDAIPLTGLISDEIDNGSAAGNRDADTSRSGTYRRWQTAYRNATIAMSVIRNTAPPDIREARLAEAMALRGYVMLYLSEQVCPGFPVINLDIDGEAVTPLFTSDPQTADSGFTRALADFDSALAIVGDSARVKNLATLGKARALLGLGRFVEAGTIAAGVDPEYVDKMVSQYGLFQAFQFPGYRVTNFKGTNGLDYLSSGDPRIEFVEQTIDDRVQYGPSQYTHDGYFPSITFASGLEARLIQAEGQLAENPSGPEWLETLNALRRTIALSDTTDPGTPESRVNLLYRERAFWLYLTAHRIGDMRRLVSKYGRETESVFPTGVDTTGGSYDPSIGLATSIPFNGQDERRYNPKITGCTSL